MPLDARSMKVLTAGMIDLVYPPRCPLCDSFVDKNDVPCEACSASLHPLDGDANFPHLSVHHLDRCVSCFAYEGRLKDALHGFKYSERLDLLRYLGEALCERILSVGNVDAVIPIPMHPKKLRTRGFNQAALLASFVGKRIGVAIDLSLLMRVCDGSPQVGLERGDRLMNIRGVFSVSNGSADALRGKSILLVDDVVTTGATLNECARVLKGSGASGVTAATVARALM